MIADFYGMSFQKWHHGVPGCVEYMARGPRVAQKPDDEPVGFGGDGWSESHIFRTSRQAMIKTYHSTSIRQKYGNMV